MNTSTASMEVDGALGEFSPLHETFGYLLEPHDCVVSKLVAGGEKDHLFAAALIEHHLIDPAVLSERLLTTNASNPVIQRVLRWITATTAQ